MVKKILLAVAIIIVVLAIIYGLLYQKNNREIESVDALTVSESLERSIQWLTDNEEKILNDNNAMLWWMLKRSAEITKDYRILKLYKAYKAKYLDQNAYSLWRPLFIPYSNVNLDRVNLASFPDYNQYFIYGLTCNKKLGNSEIVQQQMKTDFCPNEHPISPACVTHQLMGLQFRIKRQCGNASEMLSQVKELQDMIALQLRWDVRVVDVYLQRVLMLIDTGASHRVKNQWLQNILDLQLDDGGWGPYQPLVRISGDQYIGFHAKGIKMLRTRSSLHATAQGVLIMSLLSSIEADSIDMRDTKDKLKYF